MIATVDDVVAGIKSLWAAAGLPVLVTALYDWRAVPAELVTPFAVVKVKPGDKRTMTGGSYFETFAVTVWLHTDSATNGRVTIPRRFPAVDYKQRAWPGRFGRCLLVRPVAAPDDASPVNNLARDMAVTSAAWAVTMQQTRALAVR